MDNKPSSIMDLIKPFTEQEALTGSLDLWQLLIALAVGLLCGLYIFYIYKKTFNGVLYSRTFNISLILLTLVTTLIIRTISSNLTLSLGMVGALSIVRFRTAVKEAMDTVYMFWAVAVGITIGAGFYLPRHHLYGAHRGHPVHHQPGEGRGHTPLPADHPPQSPGGQGGLYQVLKSLPYKSRLKSKTVNRNGVEVTMEVRLSGDNTMLINEFSQYRRRRRRHPGEFSRGITGRNPSTPGTRKKAPACTCRGLSHTTMYGSRYTAPGSPRSSRSISFSTWYSSRAISRTPPSLSLSILTGSTGSWRESRIMNHPSPLQYRTPS